MKNCIRKLILSVGLIALAVLASSSPARAQDAKGIVGKTWEATIDSPKGPITMKMTFFKNGRYEGAYSGKGFAVPTVYDSGTFEIDRDGTLYLYSRVTQWNGIWNVRAMGENRFVATETGTSQRYDFKRK